MIMFEHLVHTPLAKALGWTLFHSMWEGALAALVLLSVLLAAQSPRVRCACACAVMAGMLAGFALTFVLLAWPGGRGGAAVPRAIPRAPELVNQIAGGIPARFRVEDALSWMTPFWIAGVMAFHLRSLAGWMAVRRLRDRGVCRPPDPWMHRLQQLRTRLRIAKPVAMLETCLADVPIVAGYLRPVILVPAGMLAGMPPAQVDAILLHELAHIRRRDYLVNLLQAVAEGFLFYHPAIWWVTAVIRSERENCCDDLVVEANVDAREYATALAALEQNRQAADQAALAVTGGSLVKRIHRLLHEPDRLALAPFLSAGILTVLAAGALVAWQAGVAPKNQQPAPKQSQVSPYTKWLEEDVVYIIDDRERAAFQNLRTDEERNHFIEQFWLRRDPTPGTLQNEFKEEHYRRIAFANKRFGWGTVAGWKTDRGRVYIVFGPPDELESHPSGRPAAGGVPARNYPVENWLYHHLKGVGDNAMIEFADASKSGDFKMVPDASRKGMVIRRP